jgi:hypothetical protein
MQPKKGSCDKSDCSTAQDQPEKTDRKRHRYGVQRKVFDMEPPWTVIMYMIFLNECKRGCEHRAIVQLKQLAAEACDRVGAAAPAVILVLHKLKVVDYQRVVDTSKLKHCGEYD